MRQRPTLPAPQGASTIGAGGLNCWVRNGSRCFPLAMTTAKDLRVLARFENRIAAWASIRAVKPSDN